MSPAGSKTVAGKKRPTNVRVEERRASARKLIEVLLLHRPNEVLLEHIRELLSILLWKVTEAKWKVGDKISNEAALECSDRRLLRHEHVYQRARMIDALLAAGPEEVSDILSIAIGCVVTVQEHAQLARYDSEYGWERYRLAEIAVVDTSTMDTIVL